jgi:hypothetical protein
MTEQDWTVIIENDHYEVAFYDLLSVNLAIVFSSGGPFALAQPIHEFRKTLSRFDTSYIFFRSKHFDWYNNINTIRTFTALAEFCKRYEKTYCLGESLGGSGAILFARFYHNISRILAFSPQYSALPSFCKFYGPLSPIDGAIPKFLFADYSTEQAVDKSILVYPVFSYEDNLHSRLFAADGFEVVYLRSYEHAAARWLKSETGTEINYLHVLLSAMFDDHFQFTRRSVNALLQPIVDCKIKPYTHWVGDMSFRCADLLDPIQLRLLSQGKPARQSSVSIYSDGRSQTEDATRATTIALDPYPAFHTAVELNPWWMVDLEQAQDVKKIIVYNRSDHRQWAEKLRDFLILVSTDGKSFKQIYRHNSSLTIGGYYGLPLVLDCNEHCRFVKVMLLGHDIFHLSRVEIYGNP